MERKNKNFVKVIALCLPLLLGACGTKKVVEGNGSTSTSQSQNANSSRGHQSEALKKLAFVQKVSDNQVYSKNIVGNMSFSLQMGSKDISVPGALRMRKDQVIRIQLFIPILGTEVGRLEFTPDYVLIIDRLHKEYIKADYNQVDFLKKQGVNFYSLQALFWNQLLLPGNQRVSESDLKKFDADLDAAGDVVPVTFKQGSMTYAWGADRNTGRILQSDVKYKTANSNSVLHIDYSNFKNVGVKQFPASLKLKFMTDLAKSDKEMQISIDMNAVKTDSNWEVETKVSDKYKKVSPEDVLSKIMNM